MKVLLETSARHVHVTREVLDILFGEGYELTNKKDLSQPGQFACEERVAVIGPKNQFPSVSILGPCRPYTQVEISMSEARTLGITAPVRMSGDLEGSGGCKLVGPKGEVEIDKGVIVAKRHLHALPEEAKELGVEDGEIIKIKVESDGRSLIFDDVIARVTTTSGLAIHIDTDEANACGAKPGMMVEVVK